MKKAFDSANLKWLELCLHMLSILDKIVKLITTILKNLEVMTLDTKETVDPIKLNQGILQGDSFSVKLFTVLTQLHGFCVAEKNTFYYILCVDISVIKP